MSASALLLISAAFHALWNAALKRSSNKVGTALAFMIVATTLNAIFAAATATVPPGSLPRRMAEIRMSDVDVRMKAGSHRDNLDYVGSRGYRHPNPANVGFSSGGIGNTVPALV